ncbi:MAG TPA: TonB-dependent receptor, partial [Opitutaceae bacterium]|nr:TonB-dependent receptor [Opitutaceae bacterium]
GQPAPPPGPAVPLAPVIVTAVRAPQDPGAVPFAVTVLDGPGLRAAPTLTLDGALRSVPGFSLFRRSDSFSANPTAQGVSLRGLGPSGASRSLVLLDGIPLNDPFGGWVAWTKVPRHSLAGAEIVRGGGASAWGNAALGGVVQLLTRADAGGVAASAGEFGTRSVEGSHTLPAGPGRLQLAGRAFATDGYILVSPEDRGAIDVPAASRHRWLAARWTQPVGADGELAVAARAFAERRNNGTPYQRNESEESFGGLTFRRQPSAGFGWTLAAYGQAQGFSSTFSGVNVARTAETPASDQFAVPSIALGAAWTGTWSHDGDGVRTSAGADVRRVRGETREHFTFANGDFTRRRVAGGRQDFAGVFALHERPLGPRARATIGGRVDWWRDADGHRDENDRATGAVLRSERHGAADGLEFSPSAGIAWRATDAWRVRLAAQHAFRRPTLNELHRPFRVGNVITEANAALATERALSGEAGLEWRGGAAADGTATALLGATAFWTELRDAVGNVTLASGPANLPPWGFIPAGGSGRQRLNLDRTRVRGLELSAEWRPRPSLEVRADYLYNDATVRRAAVAPALAGKRLAQVPRHTAAVGAVWRAGALTLRPRARWLGRQYEDDENTLRLGAALVVDLGAAWDLGPGEVFVQAENLADARVETGRSAAGVVNTGTPRLVTAGFRADW